MKSVRYCHPACPDALRARSARPEDALAPQHDILDTYATRRRYSTEEKIRIVLEGLKGEESIAELYRREGINPDLYYN